MIAAWLVVLGIFNVRHPSDWAMGDWLINYSGGFVRRGLLGAFALELRGLHVSPLWTVLCLQWVLYGIVFTCLWRLAGRVRWTWWRAALWFSPATLAFVLLDPPFAFRKDILFFALLALVLWPRKLLSEPETAPRSWLPITLLLAIGCAVCVLAHEGLFVYFPYLFAGLYLRLRSLRRALFVACFPALVSVGLFALASRHPGNAQVAATICGSLGGTMTTPPSGLCGGAIDYLAHDAAYAHREVVRTLLGRRSLALVPWLFLLPLLPLLPAFASMHDRNRTARRVLGAATALAFLLSLLLFYYGTDWTRWIYLHVFSLLLLTFYVAVRNDGKTENMQPDTPSVLFNKGSRWYWPAWALLLLYCTGWELTVYGQRPLYGSFARFVTHNLVRGQQ